MVVLVLVALHPDDEHRFEHVRMPDATTFCGVNVEDCSYMQPIPMLGWEKKFKCIQPRIQSRMLAAVFESHDTVGNTCGYQTGLGPVHTADSGHGTQS